MKYYTPLAFFAWLILPKICNRNLHRIVNEEVLNPGLIIYATVFKNCRVQHESLPSQHHFFVTCPMRYIICSFLIAVVHKASLAQIVNMESQRIRSDTTGWFGNVGTSFQFEKNAVQVINISAGAHLEYKSLKSLYLFLGNYNFLKGDGQTLN